MQEPKNQEREQQQQEAAARYAESRIFQVCYETLKHATTSLLAHLGKQDIQPERAIEFVHMALVAVEVGVHRVAVEHVKVPEPVVEEAKRRWRALGEQLYAKTWRVSVKAERSPIVQASADGAPKATTLVGLDGRPLI